MATNLRSRTRAKALLQSSPKAPSRAGSGSVSPPLDPNLEDRVKCAICLSEVVDRSYSNSCCHNFCFGCLLEWSKVKAECPLCKSSFTSIYHNIRSMDDYDEYHVPPVNRSPPYSVNHLLDLHALPDEIVSFRSHRFHPYGPSSVHSTPAVFTPFRTRSHFRLVEFIPFPRNFPANPFRDRPASDYASYVDLFHDPLPSGNIRNYQARRRVYDRGQWAQAINETSSTAQYRSSVEYIRQHSLARERINSWLYRELTVLLGLRMTTMELANVFDVITSVLENYDIRSREFRELVSSYFGDRTRQFQHEFYYFVVSGLGVEEYDARARYNSNAPSANAQSPSSPLVVVLDDSEEEPLPFDASPGDCIVIHDDVASSTRNHVSASGDTFVQSSAFDSPWDLTLASNSAGYGCPHANQAGTSEQFRGSSASFGSSDILPNDYSAWEARRDRDLFESSYSSSAYMCPMHRGSTASHHSRSTVPGSSRNASSQARRGGRISRDMDLVLETRGHGFGGTSAMESVSGAERARILHSGNQSSNEEDDCVLLGVHPIAKKPPLAVITISDTESDSDDRSLNVSSLDGTSGSAVNGCSTSHLPGYKCEIPDGVGLSISELDDYLHTPSSSLNLDGPSSERQSSNQRESCRASTSSGFRYTPPLSPTSVPDLCDSSSEGVHTSISFSGPSTSTCVKLRLLDSRRSKHKRKSESSSRTNSSKSKSKSKSRKRKHRDESSDDYHHKKKSKRSSKRDKQKRKSKKRKTLSTDSSSTESSESGSSTEAYTSDSEANSRNSTTCLFGDFVSADKKRKAKVDQHRTRQRSKSKRTERKKSTSKSFSPVFNEWTNSSGPETFNTTPTLDGPYALTSPVDNIAFTAAPSSSHPRLRSFVSTVIHNPTAPVTMGGRCSNMNNETNADYGVPEDTQDFF